MKNYIPATFYAAISLLTLSYPAYAASVRCDYSSWKGAKTEAATISWLGLGFIANEKSKTVQIFLKDGYYGKEQAKIIKQNSFTGYVYFKNQEAVDGKQYRNRYSFRVYDTGKCESLVTQPGFAPMVAVGRIK